MSDNRAQSLYTQCVITRNDASRVIILLLSSSLLLLLLLLLLRISIHAAVMLPLLDTSFRRDPENFIYLFYGFRNIRRHETA